MVLFADNGPVGRYGLRVWRPVPNTLPAGSRRRRTGRGARGEGGGYGRIHPRRMSRFRLYRLKFYLGLRISQPATNPTSGLAQPLPQSITPNACFPCLRHLRERNRRRPSGVTFTIPALITRVELLRPFRTRPDESTTTLASGRRSKGSRSRGGSAAATS